MKQRLILTLCAAILIGFLNKAVAQSDSAASSKSNFKLSINYNSNLNYYGRTDSLRSSGIFPLAELWLSPNFYINAAPIFVHNKLQSLDYAGTVATIGYQHVSDKWINSLYALKPFYEQNSGLVQSALKAQTGISISRLTNVVNVTLGGDAKFSDKTDFGAIAGLDHIIKIENKDNSIIVLDPAVYAYAGTQNFTRTYIRQKRGNPLLPPRNEQVTESSQQFNILAYEASMPIIYVKGKVQLMATPSYIIPQSLITVPNRPDLSETGESTFYTTVSLKYTF